MKTRQKSRLSIAGLSLCIACLLAPFNASAQKVIASVEIRSLDQLFEQVDAVATYFDAPMNANMIKQLLGGVLMTPNLGGVDLTSPLRVHLMEFTGDEDMPPVLMEVPTKGGDTLLEGLSTMKKKTALPGGGYSIVPEEGGGSPISMPLFVKSMGRGLLIAFDKKTLKNAVNLPSAAEEAIQVPGVIAVRLHTENLGPVFKTMQTKMEESQQQMIEMFEGDPNNDEMVEQLKESNVATSSALKGVKNFFANLTLFDMGIDMGQERFSIFTMADGKKDSGFKKMVAGMNPPPEEYMRLAKGDGILAYAGNFANLQEMMNGMVEWAAEMPQIKAASGDMMDSLKLLDGQTLGAFAMDLYAPKEGGKPEGLTVMELSDPAKYVVDYTAWVKKPKKGMAKIGAKAEVLGSRDYKDSKIVSFRTTTTPQTMPGAIGEAAPTPPVQMDVHYGAVGKNLVGVIGGGKNRVNKGFDAVANAKDATGPMLTEHKSFRQCFKGLKRIPAATYMMDFGGFMKMGMGTTQPALAKKLPDLPAPLVGCSFNIDNKYVHMDRMTYSSAKNMVTFFTKMSELQMEEMMKQMNQ